MAEAKRKPTEQAEKPSPVGVTYMMVPTGEKTGETPLFRIRRVDFDGKETRSSVLESIRAATRLVIRARLRILLDGREVLQ